MSKKRLLTEDEIEKILSVVTINLEIPVETAISIANANKELLRQQLVKVLIYPEMIEKLYDSVNRQYNSSLIQAGESVGVTSAQSIGEKQTQTTLNSVDWKDKVLYIVGSKTVIEPIGNMIDTILEKNKQLIHFYFENRTEYLELKNENYFIPSGDENGMIEWLKIEAITRHLPVGKLVKVTTESGRVVSASQSKSFLVWNGAKFIDTLGSEIKVGDILPSTKYLPKYTQTINSLDISDLRVKKEIQDIIDFDYDNIFLDNNFGFLIGLYLANTKYDDSLIINYNSEINSKCIQEKIISFCDIYGILYITEPDFIEIKSLVLSYILKTSCNDSIPWFAFTAPNDFIIGLIDGFFSHSGFVDKHGNIVFPSPSKTTLEGIAFLLSYFKIFGTFKDYQESHFLIIKDGFIKTFLNTINIRNMNLLYRIDFLHINSCVNDFSSTSRHVFFDRVVSIEHVDATNGMVYDFTVEKTRNFNLFNGLVVRDTFHKAGSGEKTVTTGVPRVEELLNATKDPKAINCVVFMKDKHETIEEMRRTIGHQVVELTFAKISKSYTIVENKESEAWYESFKIMYGDTFSKYNSCVSLKLNMDMLFEYRLDMETIRNSLMSKYSDMECVFSPDNIGQMDIFVDTSNIDLPEKRIVFIDSSNAIQIYLEEVVQPILYKIVICGIESVEAIYFKEDVSSFETDGSNFQKIMGLPFINSNKTFSNNVWDIYNVLGIEAARQFLIEEFMGIMEGINKCHIQLLAEKMTHGGSISSISRYTMRTEESGPFSKASFEETMDNFLKAGIFGQSEETKGVSSSIICGKRSQIGSGFCELSVNIDALTKPKEILTDVKEKTKQINFKQEEDEDIISQSTYLD